MEPVISSSVQLIDPNFLLGNSFDIIDSEVIPNKILDSQFNIDKNIVELFLYDNLKQLIYFEYNFNNYSVSTPKVNQEFSVLELNPEQDVNNYGLGQGRVYALYNFINLEFNSSSTSQYFISEISPDRTEIKIKSNFIPKESIKALYDEFYLRFSTPSYFDEFYIGFGKNQNFIGINIDFIEEDNSILIKLYSPLPTEFDIKSQIYIFTKVGETVAYQVDIEYQYGEYIDYDNITHLQGPNFNLNIKDFINKSTEFKSREDLITTLSSESQYHLNNILNQNSVVITPNYNNFKEFVHFSSAKNRILNFLDKVKQIEILNSAVSETVDSNISNIISNFDGYEYYLYYGNESDSYPKDTSLGFPYVLLPTTSSEVETWLGSDIDKDPNYGGIILSASLYDNNNPNWLYYTLPGFIRDSEDNQQYVDFCSMIGQHFDEIWLYTKAITQKYNTTNELDKGIPLNLLEGSLNSLGFSGFGNNYADQDLYIGLGGENDKKYTPPTGSEVITNYIAVNDGEISHNWEFPNIELNPSTIFPYAIDKVSKEILKRLYHNMIYLVKKKGTISGLRQLINIWGIPNTILRINEYGGQNKNNSNDYDYWYNRYNYAYTPKGGSYILVPWLPLKQNQINKGENIVADTIMFRFKSPLPSTSSFNETILKKVIGGSTDFNVDLIYEESLTNFDSPNLGVLKFTLGVASCEVTSSIFNNDWWSVMIKRDPQSNSSISTTYELFLKNKSPRGSVNNNIQFQVSSSFIALSNNWNNTNNGVTDGLYLGDFNKKFSGSFQELRYYSMPVLESIFDEYVMNPESVKGLNLTGSLSSYEVVNFRAPLGNELEYYFSASLSSSYSESLTSLHPSTNVIESFVGDINTYKVIYPEASQPLVYSIANRETYFMAQPIVGARNKNNNKIEIAENLYLETTLYSNVSIQNNSQINNAYTKNTANLEVGFSPQDEINEDIINTFGYDLITNYLADPRNIILGNTSNPLKKIAESYFEKYSNGNIYDYIRLIKYFDNSLFKAIKNYVPARTNLSTGLIIKQHFLERSRFPQPQASSINKVASDSNGNPLNLQNLELTQTLQYPVENLLGELPQYETILTTEIQELEGDNGNTSGVYNGEYLGSTLQIHSDNLNPFLIKEYTNYQRYISPIYDNLSPKVITSDPTPLVSIGLSPLTIGVLPENTLITIKIQFTATPTVEGNFRIGIVEKTTERFIYGDTIVYLSPLLSTPIEIQFLVNSSLLEVDSEWYPAFQYLG